MPASIAISDVNDLIVATRENQVLGKLIDIATRLTEYKFVTELIKKNRVTHSGGTSITADVIHDHNFSAQMVGLHQVIEPNINDVLTTFSVPWRHCNHHWAYERREMLTNVTGKSLQQIVDIIRVRRQASFLSMAELLETQWWTNTPDINDLKALYGLKYWVVMTGATTTAGFNGTVPSGFTTVGGLNPSTYTRWKNYNGLFTDVSENDLLDKMSRAMDQTNFVSPIDIVEYTAGIGQSSWICTNLNNKTALETELRSRNDTHFMLGQFANAVAFRNSPIRYIPKLDEDTRNPLYMLDMNYMMVAGLEGDENYEHPPANHRDQPNTYVVHSDATMNAICTSRRRQTVLAQSI